jgi:histone-lysine N-methyltransferase MLL1
MINQQQNQSLATSIPIVINNPFGQSTTSQNGITIANGVQIPNLQNLSLTLGQDGNICQNVILDQQGQQIYTSAQPLQLGQYGQTATLMPIRNFNQANVINNGIQYINTSQQQPTQYIQLAPSNSNANTPQIMTISTQQQSSNEQDQIKSHKKPLLLPSPMKGKSTSKTGSSQIIKTNSITTTSKKKLETKSQQQQISVVNSKNVQISNYQSSTSSPRNNAPTQTTTIGQQAQNIIFQQPAQQINQYPLILNQNGQLVQYITADGQNSNQIQYISQISGTNAKEIKSGSQTFITNSQPTTTNVASPQLFQNSFQLPSNNSGNLVLTPNGLSVLPVVPQSPIVGTLIQQPQALQCLSTEQMMLGSTPTAIEMVDPSSGCMYLTSQPVYYGLETIVQNTVMSSQQFVSTAMQGICQNSSFSATTTQVFQASKIEPIQMEIPAGYVFLNAADGTTIHQQPQMMDSWNVVDEKKQQQQQQHQHQQPSQMEVGNGYVNQKSHNIILKPSNNQKTKVQSKVNKIQPQIVSKIIPTTSTSLSSSNTINTTNTSTTAVLKSVNIESNQIKSAPLQQQNVQAVNQQNVMIKKQKAIYRTIGPKVSPEDEIKFNTITHTTNVKPKLKVQAKPIQQINNYQSISIKPAIVNDLSVQPESQLSDASVSKNMSANSHSKMSLKPDNSTTSNSQTTVINLPAINVVSPIQQQNSIFNNLNNKNPNSTVKSNIQNRPTNRVLPMPASSVSNVKSMNIHTKIAKSNGQNINMNNGNSNNNSFALNNGNIIGRNSSPTILDGNDENVLSQSNNIISSNNHNNINNNNLVSNSDNNDNYCEKIKSIAMELQGSKSDELFDALRRSTINNVITVTPHEQNGMEKCEKKAKLSSPIRMSDNNCQYPIPSTSASSITSSNNHKITVTKTASVCSLTKTIDSVATGANLLDEKPIDMEEMITPSIIIPQDDSSTIIDNKNECEVDNMNIESMLEELPELKATKDTVTNDEIISSQNESDKLKMQEKSVFQEFDEDTSSDRPSNSSSSSAGSTFATKASREKTPTSTTSSKVSGPKLLFEIQSQDGFTYKSNSISEIWEKLFETVQLARKVHGLMPLPEGRLNEMTGDQMLGLKTNALKYLLEQLPGN